MKEIDFSTLATKLRFGRFFLTVALKFASVVFGLIVRAIFFVIFIFYFLKVAVKCVLTVKPHLYGEKSSLVYVELRVTHLSYKTWRAVHDKQNVIG